MTKKIVLLSTIAKDTLLFRSEFIVSLVNSGHQMIVCCVDYTPETAQEIRSLGAEPVNYDLDRGGINPLADLWCVFKITRLLKQLNPDVVLCRAVKPTIYGSIAARLAGVARRVSILEGLGYAFTDLPQGFELKQFVLKKIQIFLYRISLPFVHELIFLNNDDPVDLLNRHRLHVSSYKILGGIGLDLNNFKFHPAPLKPVRFIFIGRLLAEKGVFEYVVAAKKVKNKYPDVEFVVLGSLDKRNPGALKEDELHQLLDAEIILYPGYVDNVSEWVATSSVFVLPSYREGVPRSTQEAMAIGRAILTTDVPGCRDTVADGVNGFLVPRWNAEALAEKMIYLIDHPEEIERMGQESHRIAVERFDVHQVNKRLTAWLL
ncbi:MAG: glycosyltransferase family 4 protein, partial [Lachnospiraceae bacterium]